MNKEDQNYQKIFKSGSYSATSRRLLGRVLEQYPHLRTQTPSARVKSILKRGDLGKKKKARLLQQITHGLGNQTHCSGRRDGVLNPRGRGATRRRKR